MVLTLLWRAGAGTHVLSEFRDGRPTRRLAQVDDEVVVDEGAALPIEHGIDWSDADTALRTVAEQVIGEPLGTPAWSARPTVVHRRRRRP